MPSQIRRIYNQQGLFVSNSATGSNATGILQLHRVQSIDHDVTIPKTDINQFVQLAAIGREITESPTVTLNFSYLLTNGTNEKRLGFVTDHSASCISGILNLTADEKNYFVVTAGPGVDLQNDTDYNNHDTYAFGNGFISNYSMEASVGNFPTATVAVEALTVNYYAGSTGIQTPAIVPESGTAISTTVSVPAAVTGLAGMPTALRYGDVTAVVPNIIGAKMQGAGGAHIQSCSLDVPLSREPLNRLGSRFAFSRPITFPVTVTANVTANVSDLTTGRLIDLVSSCSQSRNDLSLTLRECANVGSLGAIAMIYTLKNATLDNWSFSSSIGPSESVTMTFSSQIGAANDTVNGLFMSGSYAGL